MSKINFKRALIISSVFLTANFTMAESAVNSTSKNLAFDIGGAISNFVQSAKDTVTNVFESEGADTKKVEEGVFSDDESASATSATSTKIVSAEKNICEVYDKTFLNTIDLDTATTKAFVRIEKIEEILEEESAVREDIFTKSAEKTKKLTELQKKEKIVFREMKKELDQAKDFYKNIDETVVDTVELLEGINCDEIDKKQTKSLNSAFVETDELVTEEGIFRKSFTSSLKDKMSILQTGVKDVKEAGK